MTTTATTPTITSDELVCTAIRRIQDALLEVGLHADQLTPQQWHAIRRHLTGAVLPLLTPPLRPADEPLIADAIAWMSKETP